MDHGQFDDLTRSIIGDQGTRRAMLLYLAGGTLGGLVARLGLSESTAAKATKKRKRHKPGEKSHPAGAPQAEGKRNKRRRNKPKDKKPKNPPPVERCGPSEKRCPEGCVSSSGCCSDERRCPDDSCVALDACCFPDEMRCPDDSCASVFACCPGEKECDGSCIAEDACCHMDPAPLCDGCQKAACENGTYVCKTILEGVDCGSGYCCPFDAPYFCSEVPGHGRMCCRPGYGGGAFICE